MKYEDVRKLVGDIEINKSNLREYLIFSNDAKKMIVKPTGIREVQIRDNCNNYLDCYMVLDVFYQDNYIAISLDEIKHMKKIIN
tara:strand:+ start:323 stop:574 length:252 start_codon:yes stop_codon:yes gene_type:complete